MSGKDLSDIRLVAFDVDGVFTDGRFYLSEDGVESKAFHTQDGSGIRQLLNEGIEVAVISGRRSGAVQKRMAELGVSHVVLGCADKVAALDEIFARAGKSCTSSSNQGTSTQGVMFPTLFVSLSAWIRSATAWMRSSSRARRMRRTAFLGSTPSGRASDAAATSSSRDAEGSASSV